MIICGKGALEMHLIMKIIVVSILFVFRPLIQQKLDVLSEAGLNKENFSDLDTKSFKVPVQSVCLSYSS